MPTYQDTEERKPVNIDIRRHCGTESPKRQHTKEGENRETLTYQDTGEPKQVNIDIPRQCGAEAAKCHAQSQVSP